MATVRILRSTTAAAVPPSLVSGQIAINEADGKLFYRNGSGVVTQLATGGGGGGTELFTYANTASFPGTGATTALYLSIASGRVYQWNGSVYSEVGPVGGGGSLSATVTIPGLGDPYYDNVSLLLHGDGNLTDASGTPKTVTAVGGAAATGSAKFGSASFSFNGSSQYLSIPYSAGLDLSSGDFTVECWARVTSLSAVQNMLAINCDSTQFAQATIIVTTAGGVYWLIADGSNADSWLNSNVSSPGLVQAGAWNHYAGVKQGTSYTLYFNGVNILSYSSSSPVKSITSPSQIGWRNAAATYFNGEIDEVRVTKVARYTSSFTPPSAAYADASGITVPVVFASPTITISSQPSNQTASSGAATFSVTASVTLGGSITYQWQRSDDAGSTWASVSGATSSSLALSSLTNEADNSDQYRVVVSSTGATSVTSSAATLTVASSTPPLSLAGTRPSNLASGTTSNGYTLTGTGTSASPSVLRIGGGNNNDYRVWLIVNQTGTLNWTVTASSEDGYDGGRLYSAGAPANYTAGGFNDATPAGYTAISNWRTGTQTQTGTTSVTSGQHIVLRWTRDDGGDSGSNSIEATLSIA